MRLEHGIGMLDRWRGEGRSAWPLIKNRKMHKHWLEPDETSHSIQNKENGIPWTKSHVWVRE